MNYYNENNPKMAQWLRNLIIDGLIPPGHVDERSIVDVQAKDLDGFTQCHFFAGIGGWSRALELAEFPPSRHVWTGSCPCQNFSLCGKQAGIGGDRDLWPVWFKLIKERSPDIIFGEQVDDSPEWYDRTADDLGDINYTLGACVMEAYATDARHERGRLYFVAHSPSFNGEPHDRMGTGGGGRASAQFGGLSGLHVAGRWWDKGAWSERLPTLVRQFNGLSGVLGGFGNAIVPQVAAEFISAFMDLEGRV